MLDQTPSGLDYLSPKKWLCHTSKPCFSLQIFNPKMREQALPYPLQPAFIRIKSTPVKIKIMWESFSSGGINSPFLKLSPFNMAPVNSA